MKIAVVTDSSSDLPHDYALRAGVTVVPATITFNLSQHSDDESLSVPQLLSDMSHGKGAAVSSPPDVHAYEKAYHTALNEADHIISIHPSPSIATNIQSARAAAKNYHDLVTVLDSRSITVSLGLQVKRLVEGAARGHSVEQLVAEQKRVAQESLLTFVVDDLKFLQINGRIGAVAATVGNMLHMKPVLSVHGGPIEPVGNVLGHRRAIHALADTVKNYQRQHGSIRLAFAYAPGGEAAVRELRSLVSDVTFEDMGDWPLGAAVAANAGPGTVGVALEPI